MFYCPLYVSNERLLFDSRDSTLARGCADLVRRTEAKVDHEAVVSVDTPLDSSTMLQKFPPEVYAKILGSLPIDQAPWDRRSAVVFKDPSVIVARYLRHLSLNIRKDGRRADPDDSATRFVSMHLDLDHPSAHSAVRRLAGSECGPEVLLKCQREGRENLAMAMLEVYPDTMWISSWYALDAGSPTGFKILQDRLRNSKGNPFKPLYRHSDSYFGLVCHKRWEQAALACFDLGVPDQVWAIDIVADALRSGYVSVLQRVLSAFPDVLSGDYIGGGMIESELLGYPLGSFDMFVYARNETDLDVFTFHLSQWRELSQIISYLCDNEIPVPGEVIGHLLDDTLLFTTGLDVDFEDLQRLVIHYEEDIDPYVADIQRVMEERFEDDLEMHNPILVDLLLLGASPGLLTDVNVKRLRRGRWVEEDEEFYERNGLQKQEVDYSSETSTIQ